MLLWLLQAKTKPDGFYLPYIFFLSIINCNPGYIILKHLLPFLLLTEKRWVNVHSSRGALGLLINHVLPTEYEY